MSKIVIINEKPSQARNFAKALFGSERKMSGTLDGNQASICALHGHLYELDDPERQFKGAKDLSKWSLDAMPWDVSRFEWPFVLRSNDRATIANLKKACARADEIVIATDDDPGTHEGSGLACEVILEAPLMAPKYSRMYFTDESAPEIRKAWKKRKALPKDLRTWGEWKCAFFRNRWDYVVGLQETRVATLLGGGYDHVLREGRLKSAMTLLVSNQLEAIKAYKKVPYFENRFRDENGVTYANPDEPRCARKEDVAGNYHQSTVVCDKSERKRTAPPRLMDLAAISAVLAPKGISSSQFLKTMQSMYEHQIVSYPRTEDKTITPEQFSELAANATKIARVCGIDPALLTHMQPRPTHVRPKGAHGANRPGPNVPSTLETLDRDYGKGAKEIYLVLARSALAMFAEDYEYERQTGHVADYPAFVGAVSVPRSAGWKAVLGSELVDADDDDNAKGLGTTATPYIHEGYPPKPQQPTMRWLMKQLEKRNVGTGATRTSTYSEVTSGPERSRLLDDKRGRISMAPAGELSARILPGTHIGSLDLTEQVFDQMAQVEQGSLDPDRALAGCASFIMDDIETMRKNASAAGIEGRTDAETVSGTWQGHAVEFRRTWSGHRFTDDEVRRLLAGETIGIEATSAKKGTTFAVAGRLGESTYKGRKTFGFQPDFDAKVGSVKRSLPAEFLGHRFTDEERQALMDGRCILIKGMKSKKRGSKKFDAGVSWNESDGIKLWF